MPRSLDPSTVYENGLAGLDRLAGVERLVFMLQDFDNLMEMEGWDHFYLHEIHFAWYAEMKDWLEQIGAATSLTVLDEYEADVRAQGYELSPSRIEAWLRSCDESYFQSCPDWCGRYCGLREDRWTRAAAFLSNQGLELKTAESGVAPDAAGA